MNYSLLKDITSESHRWTVRTRVTRFSEYMSTDQPRTPLRLDLILLDEEGKTMQGQIPQKWIPMFMPQLKENSVYYIQYFEVCDARSLYRPVDHPYMMKFTAHTKITEVRTVPDSFPKYAYNLATYETLRNRIGVTDYCSDTIGVFTGCTHVRLQNTRAGQKKLRNVYLTDGRETVAVALWNEHAESFDAEHYMNIATQGPVIFLFVAVTCGQFDGKLSLQGSPLCKWYANPELPEVAALQDRCAGRLDAPLWRGPSPTQLNPERITIAELAHFNNPHLIYGNRYIVKAKIKRLVTNQSWWYWACVKCHKAAQPYEDKYKCPAPKCSSTSTEPRYRLTIMATDPTPPTNEENEPMVELVFFGSTAQEIIGVPADTLIASDAGAGAFLPTQITALYGREFDLRISVSRSSLQRTSLSYQVDGILGTANVPIPPAHSTLQPPLFQQSQENIHQRITAASSDYETTTATATAEPESEEDNATKAQQQQHTPPESETQKLKRSLEQTQPQKANNESGDDDDGAGRRVRRRLNIDPASQQN